MVLVRFKNKEEHKEVKMKLKEMKEFIEDLCYMIEERAEEDDDDKIYESDRNERHECGISP